MGSLSQCAKKTPHRGRRFGIVLAVLRVDGRQSHPNNRRHHASTAEPISPFSAEVLRVGLSRDLTLELIAIGPDCSAGRMVRA